MWAGLLYDTTVAVIDAVERAEVTVKPLAMSWPSLPTVRLKSTAAWVGNTIGNPMGALTEALLRWNAYVIELPDLEITKLVNPLMSEMSGLVISSASPYNEGAGALVEIHDAPRIDERFDDPMYR